MEQPAIRSVLLTGRPGSGKGTQATLLAQKYGWTHFSTGELFKELRGGEGELAERVRTEFDAGRLLPDWFASYLFEHEMLKLSPDMGVVFDGYPRSRAQAEIFDSVMSWLGRPYVAIDLAVSDEEVTKRMLSRAEIEHRPDSGTVEQIQARLRVYDEHTAPVLSYLEEKGALRSIDGSQTPEEVEAAIASILS